MYYHLTHAPIDFYFKHAPRDFVVEELPLYEFTGEGEHLILKIRKKSLSTWELLSKIANFLGINAREIGYAGLKDKHAMTTQYISVHKKHEAKLSTMNFEGVKILETFYHNNKIKLGHHKGNHFFIRLKKVNSVGATKIEQALKHLSNVGMPNYFGFQRFGTDGENYKMGEAICQGLKKEKNVKLQRLYINAYQSYLFNSWLDKRLMWVETQRQEGACLGVCDTPLGVFQGDVALHYPYGRAFVIEDATREAARVASRDIVISGLLAGKRALRANGVAQTIESMFDQPTLADGERRFAWVYPTHIESAFKPQEGWMELHFTLPKGSYATVLIEQIAKQNIELLSQGVLHE